MLCSYKGIVRTSTIERNGKIIRRKERVKHLSEIKSKLGGCEEK